MIKAGVIGWPVEHSLSPKLHGFWLKKYGIDGSYAPLAIPPEKLRATLRLLPTLDFGGVNITVPHKEEALGWMDAVDDIASAIGAVNTVIIKDGKLFGTNTDAEGFIQNIKTGAPNYNKDKAVIIGAGGATRAIVSALLRDGFKKVVLINRSYDRALKIEHEYESNKISAAGWDYIGRELEDTNLLINATTQGMEGQPALDISLNTLPTSAIVTDIVYKPLITPLLADAKARGNVIVDGLGMLIYQAVPGFEAWFGKRPEVTPDLKDYLLGP